MDALDGGDWRYGDDSTPEVGVTYFAGTFVRHPLAMAAARASLLYMKKEGAALQERVSRATADFAHELNKYFESQAAPVKIYHFTSVMKIAFTEEIPFGEMLFYHLRQHGVHVWDGRPCFLTMMHGPAEVTFIAQAFKKAVADMQAGGFFPQPTAASAQAGAVSGAPPVAGARLGRDPDGTPAWFVTDPARPGQYLRVNSP
jgi:glutamate-1-semialdehyde aminotransferase